MITCGVMKTCNEDILDKITRRKKDFRIFKIYSGKKKSTNSSVLLP